MIEGYGKPWGREARKAMRRQEATVRADLYDRRLQKEVDACTREMLPTATKDEVETQARLNLKELDAFVYLVKQRSK